MNKPATIKQKKGFDYKVQTVHKKYRQDLNLWEEKKKWLFFVWYDYKGWCNGIEMGYRRLRQQPNPVYFEYKEIPPIMITWAEVVEKYEGNKWLVPLNFKIID